MSEHHDAPKPHEPHAVKEEHTKGPHDPEEINPKKASDIAYGRRSLALAAISFTRRSGAMERMSRRSARRCTRSQPSRN